MDTQNNFQGVSGIVLGVMDAKACIRENLSIFIGLTMVFTTS